MNIALVLSGGTGSRLGANIPKQYIEIGNKPMISYCIRQLNDHKEIDAIQIVADEKWQKQISSWLHEDGMNQKWKGFSLPGENRQMSILHGLEDILSYASDEDYVFIHDAARPFLSQKQISDCLEGVKGHDGVIPVLPMKDTVYYSENGQVISSLLDRKCIYAGQAPEVFVLGKYYNANRQLIPDKILEINGSTEPAIMAGMDIAMIPGDEGNFKITTEADLERFRQMVDSDNIRMES